MIGEEANKIVFEIEALGPYLIKHCDAVEVEVFK